MQGIVCTIQYHREPDNLLSCARYEVPAGLGHITMELPLRYLIRPTSVGALGWLEGQVSSDAHWRGHNVPSSRGLHSALPRLLAAVRMEEQQHPPALTEPKQIDGRHGGSRPLADGGAVCPVAADGNSGAAAWGDGTGDEGRGGGGEWAAGLSQWRSQFVSIGLLEHLSPTEKRGSSCRSAAEITHDGAPTMADSGILRRPHFLRMQSSSIRACCCAAFDDGSINPTSDERRLRGMWAGKTCPGNSLRGPNVLVQQARHLKRKSRLPRRANRPFGEGGKRSRNEKTREVLCAAIC